MENDHTAAGNRNQGTPDETGLLTERYEDGQRIFDIATPSLRELSRRVVVSLAVFLLLWAAFTVAGVVPLNTAAVLGFGGLSAMLALGALLDYYQQSRQHVSLLVSEGRLLVQNHLGGLWKHTAGSLSGTSGRVITSQPYELYCTNAGKFRLPLAPRQLIIVTGECRVQAGRHLSERELAYVFEAVCETTGWQEEQLVGPAKLSALILAGLTVGVLVGHWFGYLAYEYGITPTVSQGRFAVGTMATAVTWSLLALIATTPGKTRSR